MIHYDLLSESGVLVITPHGALEKSDFEMLAAVVDPYIEEKGKLNGVMIESESFPGWDDFSALVPFLTRDLPHFLRCNRSRGISRYAAAHRAQAR